MSLNNLLKTFDDENTVVKVNDKYVEKPKEEVSLKGILQRKRLKLVRESSAIPRGVTFAPHGMTFSFCRRAKIAQLAGLMDLHYEKQRPSTQTGMDIGTYLHDMVQTYFWNVGMLKGTYKCLKCDKKYDNLVSPQACPSGIKSHTRQHLVFREVVASEEKYLLRGRCDGILVMDEGDKLEEVLEVKSLPVKPLKNSNEFQFYFDYLDERGPKEAHVIQLQFYLFMLKMGSGHLLYISKNDGRIKTFQIKYDHSIIEPYLNEITHLREQAELLKAGKPLKLPECCSSETCDCHSIISPPA